MLAHGISAGGLFMLCGALYERLHTRDLRDMGGLWARFSALSPIMLFFVVASLGLPGLGNFLGEFLILLGTFPAHPAVAVVAAGGLILSAVYSLSLMQRAFHGKPREETPLRDLNRREIATLGVLIGGPDRAWPVPAADSGSVAGADAGVAGAVHAEHRPRRSQGPGRGIGAADRQGQ